MDEELSLVNLSLHGNPRAGMNRGLISIVSDLAEKVDKISHVIDFEREYNERILDRLNRIFWLGGGFLTIFTILQLVLGYFAP